MSSDAVPTKCLISVNPDITGPGVRIALYLQSFLSVILVRVSPKDAPGAYWSMTATAMSLIISSFITGALGLISLLDAIVVVYVLILPIVASAFGVSSLASPYPKRGPTTLRRAPSPLLILFNWLRSALTYSFALYVWTTAPSFGITPDSSPSTSNSDSSSNSNSDSSSNCNANASTKLIFFGASLPALRSGRILNLTLWSLLTFLFLYRTLKGLKTLLVAFRALLSLLLATLVGLLTLGTRGGALDRGGNAAELVRPKEPPQNVLNLESSERYDYGTGEREYSERAYRPTQVFHEMLRGMMSQILGWAPSGTQSFYGKYGQFILAALISVWAIVMTELELRLNEVAQDNEWGFGQILPLILTISPLLSLVEALLSKRARGPLGLDSKHRLVRFTIHGASGLSRPSSSAHSHRFPRALWPAFAEVLQLVEQQSLMINSGSGSGSNSASGTGTGTVRLSKEHEDTISACLGGRDSVGWKDVEKFVDEWNGGSNRTNGGRMKRLHAGVYLGQQAHLSTKFTSFLTRLKKHTAPSPFAVVTIGDSGDIYTTYDLRNTRDPVWRETFEVEVGDVSTVVVRVFDLKCMSFGVGGGGLGRKKRRVGGGFLGFMNRNGGEDGVDKDADADVGGECTTGHGRGGANDALIGYTTVLPSAMIWADQLREQREREHKDGEGEGDVLSIHTAYPTSPTTLTRADSTSDTNTSNHVHIHTFPLLFPSSPSNSNLSTLDPNLTTTPHPILTPTTTISLSISTAFDSRTPIPPPALPEQYTGLEKVTEERKVKIVRWRGKRVGQRERVVTESYHIG